MRFGASAIIWIVFVYFQNLDIFAIIERFGFPTALCFGMFVYFSRAIDKTNGDANAFRTQTIEILLEQLKIAQQGNKLLEKQTTAIEEK